MPAAFPPAVLAAVVEAAQGVTSAHRDRTAERFVKLDPASVKRAKREDTGKQDRLL